MIQTFSDFQLIYVLTGSGPANSTHLIATYAYQIGVGAGAARRRRGAVALHVPGAVRVVWVQLRHRSAWRTRDAALVRGMC